MDVGAALEMAVALGADREAAAELIGAVVIGFNRALGKRDLDG